MYIRYIGSIYTAVDFILFCDRIKRWAGRASHSERHLCASGVADSSLRPLGRLLPRPRPRMHLGRERRRRRHFPRQESLLRVQTAMVDDYVEKSHEMQMRQEVGVVNRSHSMKSTVLLCIYVCRRYRSIPTNRQVWMLENGRCQSYIIQR